VLKRVLSKFPDFPVRLVDRELDGFVQRRVWLPVDDSWISAPHHDPRKGLHFLRPHVVRAINNYAGRSRGWPRHPPYLAPDKFVGYETGTVQCVLRDAQSVDTDPAGETFISPRIKERLHTLPNGETIVIPHRRIKERPTGVDGVLLQDSSGALHWQSHVLIDDLTEAGTVKGWPVVVAERARQWDGQFAFHTSRPNADGTVEPDKRGLRPAQIGALHAIGAHWSLYHKAATIIMPTGTGKTETMLSVLANFMRAPLLVVVPADALRSQTARKFLTFGLLRNLAVLRP
jgi:hypothetical protein